jgi:hypothetical protein
VLHSLYLRQSPKEISLALFGFRFTSIDGSCFILFPQASSSLVVDGLLVLSQMPILQANDVMPVGQDSI